MFLQPFLTWDGWTHGKPPPYLLLTWPDPALTQQQLCKHRDSFLGVSAHENHLATTCQGVESINDPEWKPGLSRDEISDSGTRGGGEWNLISLCEDTQAFQSTALKMQCHLILQMRSREVNKQIYSKSSNAVKVEVHQMSSNRKTQERCRETTQGCPNGRAYYCSRSC